MGGGGSHGSGEGQDRESGSELHFAYDKVERLGAWNSGWQIVIGVGYGICIKISRERADGIVFNIGTFFHPKTSLPSSKSPSTYDIYGIDLDFFRVEIERGKRCRRFQKNEKKN